MGTDLAPLVDRIGALLHEPVNGSRPKLLERMEHTLTDGYAHALRLEGQTLKLEREIGVVALNGDTEQRVERLTELADSLAVTERDLVRLRALLAELRAHAEDVRKG